MSRDRDRRKQRVGRQMGCSRRAGRVLRRSGSVEFGNRIGKQHQWEHNRRPRLQTGDRESVAMLDVHEAVECRK
jgi:hypothetical protein